MTQPNLTSIVVVLDKSGSMNTVRDATIKGYNDFINEQRRVLGECNITLILFDTKQNLVYDFTDIRNAPPLNHEDYRPNGDTALLDAIGDTVDRVGARLRSLPENKRPSKVIFTVMTDGEENSSKWFNKDRVNRMVTHQTEKYSWEFVFLGCEQRAIRDAYLYGFNPQSTLHYTHSGAGYTRGFATLNTAVTNSRTGGTIGTVFNEQMRSANTPAVVGTPPPTPKSNSSN